MKEYMTPEEAISQAEHNFGLRSAELPPVRVQALVGSRVEADEALKSLKILCDYAYEQGFHEMGYDPVEEIAERLNEANADKEGYRLELYDIKLRIERVMKAHANASAQGCEAYPAASGCVSGSEEGK